MKKRGRHSKAPASYPSGIQTGIYSPPGSSNFTL